MICNCSLAGTDACKNCNNNKKFPSLPASFGIVYEPIIQYWCPCCDALLDVYDKYCHNCGCKLDWTKIEKE